MFGIRLWNYSEGGFIRKKHFTVLSLPTEPEGGSIPNMFVAAIVEDGRRDHTLAFPTVAEAFAAGKRRWMTGVFSILEVEGEPAKDGIFEAIRYVIYA